MPDPTQQEPIPPQLSAALAGSPPQAASPQLPPPSGGGPTLAPGQAFPSATSTAPQMSPQQQAQMAQQQASAADSARHSAIGRVASFLFGNQTSYGSRWSGRSAAGSSQTATRSGVSLVARWRAHGRRDGCYRWWWGGQGEKAMDSGPALVAASPLEGRTQNRHSSDSMIARSSSRRRGSRPQHRRRSYRWSKHVGAMMRFVLVRQRTDIDPLTGVASENCGDREESAYDLR
jgi:hypothetical protein